tara:strand:+ start:16020 stop:16985 length:966 start_codon:yes stop_codon:yes gene_type:complete
MKNKIICWWSGGITSAVACKVSIDLFVKDNVRVIFIDTCNEHPDTYRFFVDCEKLYGVEIEIITGIKDYKCRLKGYKDIFNERHQYFQPNKNTHYYSIADVWDWYLSLNVSYGAVCSTELKRAVREKWQLENEYKHQVFGFEFDKKEFNRAMSISLNHPKSKPIFPLLMMGYNKEKCIEIINDLGIDIPQAYKDGLRNNNCLGENYGCVQGGIGYWQMIYRTNKPYYMKRALKEHELTDKQGFQVTMCKEQSEDAKELENKKDALLFLLPHPDYPQNRTVLDVYAREPKPMVDCSGFCGTFDLSKRSKTEEELNYQTELFK